MLKREIISINNRLDKLEQRFGVHEQELKAIRQEIAGVEKIKSGQVVINLRLGKWRLNSDLISLRRKIANDL